MLNADVKTLVARGDHLFGARGNILTFWQEVAENFCPHRAMFTASPTIGSDFAANLTTSYPIIVHRELSGAISSMLRRRDTEWFQMTTEREDKLDSAGLAWLKRATKIQRRAMYDKRAKFIRATSEGDNDFTAFGQTVITRDVNWNTVNLQYRCWFLRDCAWAENAQGDIDELHINWSPSISQLIKKVGEKNLHTDVAKHKDKEPFKEIRCRRITVPSDYYKAAPGKGGKAFSTKMPFTVLLIDLENQHVMYEGGSRTKGFSLPRWVTVQGSSIAYSPAVVAGLPDARLLQAMTLTLLEAGESAVRPPLLGNADALRSDANLFPGGITWAQLEGDQELANVLAPVFAEKSAIPIGLEMTQDARSQIAAAFFLNKLSLPNPERAGKMTAFEIAERIKEWVRSAIPIFEPMETEYNADLCEGTFEELFYLGTFGPINEMPQSLRDQEFSFRFESPLSENIDRQRAHTFMEARQLIVDTAAIDQASLAVLDMQGALRDAVLATGIDAQWVRDEKDIKEYADQLQQSKEVQEMAQAAEGAGVAAQAVGKGQQALEAA